MGCGRLHIWYLQLHQIFLRNSECCVCFVSMRMLIRVSSLQVNGKNTINNHQDNSNLKLNCKSYYTLKHNIIVQNRNIEFMEGNFNYFIKSIAWKKRNLLFPLTEVEIMFHFLKILCCLPNCLSLDNRLNREFPNYQNFCFMTFFIW